MNNSTHLPKIDNVIAVAREAARTIMEMRDSVTVTRKPDGSPVTQADLKSNLILVKGLSKLIPGVGVVAEENEPEINDSILKSQDTYWIADPLDMTTAYIGGGDRFSVNVGLVAKGVPVLGIVYFPALGIMYFTGDNGKAYRQEDGKEAERIEISHANPRSQPMMVVAKKSRQHAYPGQYRRNRVLRTASRLPGRRRRRNAVLGARGILYLGYRADPCDHQRCGRTAVRAGLCGHRL